MSGSSQVVFIACLFFCFSRVHCGCNDTTPYRSVTYKENAITVGTLSAVFKIYTVGYRVYFNVTAVLDPSQDYTSNFSILNDRRGHRLALTTPIELDLDRPYARKENGDLELKVMFKCTHLVTQQVEYAERYIYIQAVDEFAPRIPMGVNFQVNEDAPINTTVGNLISKLYDLDIPPVFTNLTFRSVNNSYTKANYGTFDITNQGDIILRKKLDYDRGARDIRMDIIITDANDKQSYGMVTINVGDISDGSIRFVYDGCKGDCDYMHYRVHVPTYAGCEVLTHIDNGPIYAEDNNADLVRYKLIGANWKNFHEFFTIDFKTGNLTVVGKFTEVETPFPYLIVRANSYSLRPSARTTAETTAYSLIFLVPEVIKRDDL